MQDAVNPGATGSTPFVSVVLPVRNEARFIRRALESVVSQDYPADRLAIIVADGMSTDGTREIVESFKARHRAMQLVDNPAHIVPTGLNAAIDKARGDVVVRVDGHCEVAGDYVARCVSHLAEGADAVGGPLDTVGETTAARAIALAMSSPFGVGNSAFRTCHDQSRLVDTVAFPAYPRRVIQQVGRFDEELVRDQDDEYNYRLRKQGGRILLAPDVRSRYFSRSSLRSLGRQYFQYGYWKVRVLQKHPRQMRPRQFAPPAFVAAFLLLAAAVPMTPLAAWALATLAAAYTLVNLTAAALLSRGDVRVLFLLPVVFATLHVSYGAGFLTGLAAFWRRWLPSSPGRPRLTGR
jgi:glycosyltransferase involved in cell wall biosynthesis